MGDYHSSLHTGSPPPLTLYLTLPFWPSLHTCSCLFPSLSPLVLYLILISHGLLYHTESYSHFSQFTIPYTFLHSSLLNVSSPHPSLFTLPLLYVTHNAQSSLLLYCIIPSHVPPPHYTVSYPHMSLHPIISQERVSGQSGCQNCRVGSVARIPWDQRSSGILATDPSRLFW